MIKKIDWEQRRFEASVQILAGMCANYHHAVPSYYRAEAAVKLADSLMEALVEVECPSFCKEASDENQTE